MSVCQCRLASMNMLNRNGAYFSFYIKLIHIYFFEYFLAYTACVPMENVPFDTTTSKAPPLEMPDEGSDNHCLLKKSLQSYKNERKKLLIPI